MYLQQTDHARPAESACERSHFSHEQTQAPNLVSYLPCVFYFRILGRVSCTRSSEGFLEGFYKGSVSARVVWCLLHTCACTSAFVHAFIS